MVGTTLDEDSHDVSLLVEYKYDEERDYFSMTTKERIRMYIPRNLFLFFTNTPLVSKEIDEANDFEINSKKYFIKKRWLLR